MSYGAIQGTIYILGHFVKKSRRFTYVLSSFIVSVHKFRCLLNFLFKKSENTIFSKWPNLGL